MPRRKWAEIKAGMRPESVAVAAAKTEQILAGLRLGELRKARGLTQEAMAERLAVRQVSVSRMESRTHVRVSTLRSVVEAMGGTLEIRACFPDAEYRLDLSGADAQVEQILQDRTAGVSSTLSRNGAGGAR